MYTTWGHGTLICISRMSQIVQVVLVHEESVVVGHCFKCPSGDHECYME